MNDRSLFINPVGSTRVRLLSQVPVVVLALPMMASEQSGRVGVFNTGPNTLKYLSLSVYALPFGFVAGVTGFPDASTTDMMGLAPVEVVAWNTLPLFQFGK
jgi:hypothetical protein